MVAARRLFAAAAIVWAAGAVSGRAAPDAKGATRKRSLLQSWRGELESSGVSDHSTPVRRVVNLLQDMSNTLKTEMKEDEELYEKLACWCNKNEVEKDDSIAESTTKIADLHSTIVALNGKHGELEVTVKQVKADLAENEKALAEAEEFRKKQAAQFHKDEVESIQAIEQLRGAIIVLSKHHVASLAELRGTRADTALVTWALKNATALMEARHSERYYPAYSAQSGQVLGILRQLKDDMESDLSASQQQEMERAGAFGELKGAKVSEIDNGKKELEEKADDLANTANSLGEAKIDLAREEGILSAEQLFLKNLRDTCSEADRNFEQRKKARLMEMLAVAEAIKILESDTARDAILGTWSLLQVTAELRQVRRHRHAAADALRGIAEKVHDPRLSALAMSIERDAFKKVIKAIDAMVTALGVQQADEVKKKDWCVAELSNNEIMSARSTDQKVGLEAKVAELASTIKSLEGGISDCSSQIAQLHLNLQQASENRKVENMDFQTTVADQGATVQVLRWALDKLTAYYGFVETWATGQVGASTAEVQQQVPPVPQKTYKPSSNSTAVIGMIEKLIGAAQVLVADSQHAENQAEAAYEQLVQESNENVKALLLKIASKTRTKGKTRQEMIKAESDLQGTIKELEGLTKFDIDIHAECDYLMKNFDVRQSARAEEIAALGEAKSILSGATFK